MMLLAARKVLNAVDDGKELPRVVSVNGLLLVRMSHCTACKLEVDVHEPRKSRPRENLTKLSYWKIANGSFDPSRLLHTLNEVWPRR